MSTELAPRGDVRPVRGMRRIPSYVLTLRPVQVMERILRKAMTWKLGIRIVLLLFGGYGLFFLVFACQAS